jgi:AmmeMemoRadiSam system protein B/AmmeMemoRadiSam system protein A
MSLAVGVGAVLPVGALAAGEDGPIRLPQFAGGWYPADFAPLKQTVDDFLARASPPKSSAKPVALIVPHAGYRFSGPVAAAGYRYLQGHTYKRVIVMAFHHRRSGQYDGVDVGADLSAYATALGNATIDHEFCEQLLQNPVFVSNRGIDAGEHSLELQLPFLQRTLQSFKFVPMLVGRMSDDANAEAAKALIPLLDDDTLLVASTDFTHFGPRYRYTPFGVDVPNRIRKLGDDAAAPILRCDFDGFVKHLADTGDTICGRGPVTLLLRILSMHEGAQGVRAGFDTSGNITGDWTNSVTYQSIVFTPRQGTLGDRERAELLKLARRTVTAHLTGQKLPEVNTDNLPAALRADGACFVTLENHGRLRGCIGNMTADRPLYQAVIGNAVSACRDHRFVNDPVTAAELKELHVEISYLTPMKLVESPDKIVVGQHGMLITMGRARGVLLPQVASRRAWTRNEFLAHTCRKAGLPPDAWKQPQAQIYSFEAEVFGEPELTAASDGERR